jgi:uncharacterized membrane protein
MILAGLPCCNTNQLVSLAPLPTGVRFRRPRYRGILAPFDWGGLLMNELHEVPPDRRFDAAEIGALAHLWRGEVYRSTVWRVRFDTTTNWAVVTTGIAFSASFSAASASPLPLVLVGLLVVFFLLIEARRYRYFNIWRLRARALETNFYASMLRGDAILADAGWMQQLAQDYRDPRHRITYASAVGRRVRRNYGWIFAIQALAYYGKLTIHPTAMTSMADLWQRAAIGPISGEVVVAAGVLFHGSWMVIGALTLYKERHLPAHERKRLDGA